MKWKRRVASAVIQMTVVLSRREHSLRNLKWGGRRPPAKFKVHKRVGLLCYRLDGRGEFLNSTMR